MINELLKKVGSLLKGELLTNYAFETSSVENLDILH